MMRAPAQAFFMVALMTVSAVGPPALAQCNNLLANPGFEEGGGSYDGWFTFGDGVQLSLPDGDNIIRTGSAAAKIFGEFTGCPGAPQFDVGGFGQAFAPTPGMEYELSGFAFVSSGDPIPGTDTCDRNRLIAKIVFFDDPVGGGEISSNEVIVADGSSPTDWWRPFTVSAPVPTGAQRVEALFLFLQPACDTGAVFVDDTSFCEVSPTAEPNVLANPSFDTGLGSWTTFGNVLPEARSFAVHTAPGSAKLFSTFMPDADSGMFQTVLATPGSVWKLDLYALTTCVEDPITGTNDNFMLARIVFRDAGNNEIGAAEKIIMDSTVPLGSWVRHTVIANDAPAGTVAADVFILFVSPSLLGGAAWVDDVSLQELDPVGIDDQPAPVPVAAELGQNAPNPFNPSTRIDFVLTEATAVDLSIYDVAGRWIVTLHQGQLDAGSHQVTWDGKTASGASAPAGVYRYVLRTSAGQTSRSMTLLK
jgi:hypothetical protein